MKYKQPVFETGAFQLSYDELIDDVICLYSSQSDDFFLKSTRRIEIELSSAIGVVRAAIKKAQTGV